VPGGRSRGFPAQARPTCRACAAVCSAEHDGDGKEYPGLHAPASTRGISVLGGYGVQTAASSVDSVFVERNLVKV
jgi:hypothetical protein